MKGVWFKLAALVCAMLSVSLIVVINLPIVPYEYDVLGEYIDYTPGKDGIVLLTRNCSNVDDYFEYMHSTNSMVCMWESGPIYSATLTIDKHGIIQQIYFNVRKCGVRTGELILSTNADIRLLRYSRIIMSTRKLAWNGGEAYAWTRRGKIWTVYNTCIWGIYLREG